MSFRSTLDASGMPRVWTLRIISRPILSGGCTVTRLIEATRAQQCLVEDVRAVGRREHNHALARAEPVHFGQDLIEGLLLLGVATREHTCTARTADGIQLVDENDRPAQPRGPV